MVWFSQSNCFFKNYFISLGNSNHNGLTRIYSTELYLFLFVWFLRMFRLYGYLLVRFLYVLSISIPLTCSIFHFQTIFFYTNREFFNFIVIIHKHNRRMGSRGDLGWSRSSVPQACHTRRLNGTVLRMRPKNRGPCLRCGTIKVPPCLKDISAE